MASMARSTGGHARPLRRTTSSAEIGISDLDRPQSDCKFLAKLASDRDKPRGYTIIGRAEAVCASFGLCPSARSGASVPSRQNRLGPARLHDDRRRPGLHGGESFARRIGSEGSHLWRLAHGIDSRERVSVSREAKSVSSETTFRPAIYRPPTSCCRFSTIFAKRSPARLDPRRARRRVESSSR